jgi:uncharacterized membrane protein YgcG
VEAALVPTGEVFSDRQNEDVARAIRGAEQDTGLHFSVYVGSLAPSTREQALTLHAALGDDAATSVLVAVDPGLRQTEIVTGPDAKRFLDDHAAALGALAMTTQFNTGDLAGGIVNGLRTLAEHARHPQTLHLDQP